MRIKEDFQESSEAYSDKLQARVEEIYQFVCQVEEIKRLLAEFKEESLKLREIFLSEAEEKERMAAKEFFDTRMQATVYYTLRNIEGYQQYGWKELINEGEGSDD